MGDSKDSDTVSCKSATPKLKYDWYQTDTYVTVNVLIKNVSEHEVKVAYEERYIKIDLPSDEIFDIHLAKAIIPSKCTHRVKQTKIELKLKKLNEDLWTNLEAAKASENMSLQPKTKTNWDKLVESELKDDAAQGEAALNELFQKIYTEGSDEVKKAMNKSFLESGGTVLSTNWNEVGENKVEIKPPDGMEWKKWDEP